MPDHVGFGAVAAAFLRRDLAVAASYRLTFALRIAGLGAAVASLALLGRFVGRGEYVSFWLVGIAVAESFRVLATAPARKVREAQLEGTLEAVLSTPAPAAFVVLAAPLADELFGLLETTALLACGVIFLGVRFAVADSAAVVVAAALSLAAFVSLGLIGCALTMFLRRTDPVSALVAIAGVLVGGVLFPTAVMPPVLRAASYLFPLAPSLEALRATLLHGAGLAQIGDQLVALAIFVAIAAPLGAGLLAAALRRARADGSLGHY